MTSTDTLVYDFERKILEREGFQNNPKNANKLYREIHAIFKMLKSRGELRRLEPLLMHKSFAVALFAAKYYLLEDELAALKKLRELSKRDGIDGFTAENMIEQWEKGEISYIN